MDYNGACKELYTRGKYEVGKTMEDKASYLSGLEEGEFRRHEPFGSETLVHKSMDTRTIKLSSSTQVTVKKGLVMARQSMSPERGTHGGSTAKSTDEQPSILEDQSVNLRQPTFYRKYSEKHRRSYSLSFHISSKERQYQRKRNCFGHKEYPDVLEKIEKVCSERLNKLLLQQNGDRKEFNILQKKQELEFFREHVHSYKVRYERVIPTVIYDRIRLPKLVFCTLCGILHKHIQDQLRKFVRRQINDRNKEKRIKERWIFEAKAGYLKKYFGETSLTYSEFEMVKPKWHVHDYSETEQQLKYLDMRSLSSAIEEIASSNELADSHTSKNIDVSESPLKTNGGTKYGLSVSTAAENTTIDSMPSLSNCSPAVDFGEKVGTQVAFSSPPQNNGESMGRSCSSVETLEIVKSMTVNSGNTFPVSREKRKHMSADGDASEGSCSRSHRKLSHEFVTNFHETMCHEEPQATRLSSADVNQGEQSDNAAREDEVDQTSSLAQVTERQSTNGNVSALTKSFTQLEHRDRTGQNGIYPHQLFDGITCSVRTGLDSPGASDVQQQSTNQMMARSMVEQCTPGVRLQSDATTIELNGVVTPCGDHTSSFSSVDVNQGEPSDSAGSEDVSSDQTSSLAQVTEQRSNNGNVSTLTKSLTQLQHRDRTGQNGIYPHQRFDGNTCSVRTGLDNPGASNVQQQSTNQMMTRSMVEQCTPGVRLQSDATTIDLNEVVTPCGDHTSSFLSVDVNQGEQSDNAGREDVSSDQTSTLAQVTEQRSTSANVSTLTKSLTQLQRHNQTGQNGIYPHQRFNGNTCSVRTGLDNPEASNVQQRSTNQMMTRSMVDQCTPGVSLRSDATTIELNEVVTPYGDHTSSFSCADRTSSFSCGDHTSSFSQATERQTMNASSSSLTQHPYCDEAFQTVTHQYEPSAGNTTLVRTWLDSPGELNVPWQSANQTTTNSTSEHMLEGGLQSDPFTPELSRLLTLRDLVTKRHLLERQKIILEREMEEAEIKKKYDELFQSLEMETLQKKKDLQLLQQKVCKQQILAEAFQIEQPSTRVPSWSQRGEPSRTMDVPHQSSGQQIVRFPTSATMNQPPRPAVRSSTHQFLRQPSVITQEGAMNTSGRSASTLTSAPRRVMVTRIPHRTPAPHLQALFNRLPASHHGAASLER